MIDKWMDDWIDRQTIRQIDGWMMDDRMMDDMYGWTDRRTDGEVGRYRRSISG